MKIIGIEIRIIKRKKFEKDLSNRFYTLHIKFMWNNHSSDENAGSSNGFDSSFGGFAELLGFNYHGLVGESSFTQYFEKSSFGDINDGGLTSKKVPFPYYFRIIYGFVQKRETTIYRY